jgi:hypothetical protein
MIVAAKQQIVSSMAIDVSNSTVINELKLHMSKIRADGVLVKIPTLIEILTLQHLSHIKLTLRGQLTSLILYKVRFRSNLIIPKILRIAFIKYQMTNESNVTECYLRLLVWVSIIVRRIVNKKPLLKTGGR